MKQFEKTKLLPCAHCGGNDIHIVRNVIRDDFSAANCDITWHVECYDCGVRTIEFPEETTLAMSTADEVLVAMENAIECATRTWNTRANATNPACDRDTNAGNVQNDATSAYVDSSLIDKYASLLDALCYMARSRRNGDGH